MTGLVVITIFTVLIYVIGNTAEYLAHKDVIDPEMDLREIEKNWDHDLMLLYSSHIPTRDLRQTMVSRKVEMTLYFTGPTWNIFEGAEPMRLVEEADSIKISPPVELTDTQMMEEMQYE